METLPVVSVRGESVVEVEPEIATLDVVVAAQDKDRDRTLESLDRRSSAVLALVESFGDAVERVEAAALRITPEFKDGKPRERITGYSAYVRHTVHVVDFTRLGDLVARVAEQEMVEVRGPHWALRAGSAVYREARMTAARDAVERAREYAGALGSRVTGLVELADTGLMSEAVWRDNGGGFAVAAMAAPQARAMGGGLPQPVTFDLEPVHQVVRANVEARFTIEQPASL